MNGIQVSHHISSSMGEASSVKPTTTFLWWSQARKQQNTRPELRATRSWHNLSATTSDVWKQNYQNGFNHSRKDSQGDRHVRQTSLQVTWKYHFQHFLLPRIIQQNLLQTNQEESTSTLRRGELESCEICSAQIRNTRNCRTSHTSHPRFPAREPS